MTLPNREHLRFGLEIPRDRSRDCAAAIVKTAIYAVLKLKDFTCEPDELYFAGKSQRIISKKFKKFNVKC